MVDRYKPTATLKPTRFSDVRTPAKHGHNNGVGRASIKKSTVDKIAREQKKFRGTNTGDSFQNFALNIGYGTNNALSQSQYGFAPITRIRTLLDFIHRGSWLGGVAVDLLAEDMTRGGIEILTVEDPKSVESLQQCMTRLKVWAQLADNIKWSNLYGGSIAVLLIDGQSPETPLRIETVGKDAFKGLTVFDRWMVDPDLSNLVKEYGPHLGLPEFYKVVSDAPAMRGQRIHYTRCIRLEGVRLPYWQRVMENLWGLSVFERLYDRMIAFDSATMGAAQLIYKSYLRTYKIDGLQEAATAAGDALAGIANRVELMRKYQGIEGITLLDSSDDFTTHESSGFSGIADVLVHFAEQLSGALQIPLVRLLGQSPAGLNSTGESDLRTYYDNILQRQERDLREGVNLILRVAARSLSIKLPDSFNFNFVPLWQLNETEKADVADKVTRFVLEVEAAGLVSPRIALQELRQLAKITGKWTNIDDKQIREASDVAEPPEAGGAGGNGGEEGAEGPPVGSEGEPEPKPGEEKPPGGKKPAPEAPQARAEGEVEGLENFRKLQRAVGTKDRSVGSGDNHPPRSTHDEAAAYALPLTEIGGLQVVIETRAGTIRRGEGWSAILDADYGYIRRVPSAEGPTEWLDCFIGPAKSSRDVWIIDSIDPETGVWDEHKVMLAYTSSRDAIASFKRCYNDDAARRIGAVTHMSFDSAGWKNWIANGDKTVPLAPELRNVA